MWSEGRQTARALLRAANGLGSGASEAAWIGASIAAGGLWRGSPPKRWVSPGTERVLVVAPHPDDEACGCAGTLIRHVRAGDAVRIAVVTDGSASKALGLDPQEMMARRSEEERASAELIGAEVSAWKLPERAWSTEEAEARLRQEVRAFSPTVIYAPSELDFHPDHRGAAEATARVVGDQAAPVRVYASQVPLTPLIVNLAHDVSDLGAELEAVLRAHLTQAESVLRTLRTRRYAAAFYGAQRYLEAFCQMSGSVYRQLNLKPSGTFRGLRIRAWGDPLAGLAGTAERLRWRRALSHAAGGATQTRSGDSPPAPFPPTVPQFPGALP